jgi:hypothetical protein
MSGNKLINMNMKSNKVLVVTVFELSALENGLKQAKTASVADNSNSRK